jgi:hypothetical protein
MKGNMTMTPKGLYLTIPGLRRQIYYFKMMETGENCKSRKNVF